MNDIKFSIIYWKGLKKNDVKVREFETLIKLDEFLKQNKEECKEYLICRHKGKDEKGVSHFVILHRGSYVLYNFLALIVSITVMGAIIAGAFYFRHWLIVK